MAAPTPRANALFENAIASVRLGYAIAAKKNRFQQVKNYHILYAN
jgi:hypothetical protein